MEKFASGDVYCQYDGQVRVDLSATVGCYSLCMMLMPECPF